MKIRTFCWLFHCCCCCFIQTLWFLLLSKLKSYFLMLCCQGWFAFDLTVLKYHFIKSVSDNSLRNLLLYPTIYFSFVSLSICNANCFKFFVLWFFRCLPIYFPFVIFTFLFTMHQIFATMDWKQPLVLNTFYVEFPSWKIFYFILAIISS